ncbi:MAG: isoprenylcysteine carboxylmethyltransferase family protein [Candidatus Omnitrophica bacterium]|nr:isoprenylcysteine carboxylmethyltransferase family protein [Candidatus Omnitrophota bacterium]
MRVFPKLRKPRFLLIYPLIPALFLMAATTERQLHIGIVLAVVGMGIRLWANGYVGHVKVNWTQKWRGDAKVGTLITAGPYAYIRHPLYFGSLLIAVGVLVIVGRLWLSLIALGSLLIVYHRKIVREEALLRDEWGPVYARYQQAVPRYWPTWRHYAERRSQWSWKGILASKELKTVAWTAILVVGLYFWEELTREHEFLPAGEPLEYLKHLALLAAAVMLMAADGLFELTRRLRH